MIGKVHVCGQKALYQYSVDICMRVSTFWWNSHNINAEKMLKNEEKTINQIGNNNDSSYSMP